jgi:hypothetical protein
MIDYPMVPIQGSWFGLRDDLNHSRKPFLMHTNPTRLAEQMGSKATCVKCTRNTEEAEDFTPLTRLSHEIIQLQQFLQKRHRLSMLRMTELHTVLKHTLAAGRRVLDDAFLRDDLWRVTKSRLKNFVSAVFVSHLRGRPLKLDDPRAQKERELFCALLENGPMDLVWKKQRDAKEAVVMGITTNFIVRLVSVPRTYRHHLHKS